MTCKSGGIHALVDAVPADSRRTAYIYKYGSALYLSFLLSSTMCLECSSFSNCQQVLSSYAHWLHNVLCGPVHAPGHITQCCPVRLAWINAFQKHHQNDFVMMYSDLCVLDI